MALSADDRLNIQELVARYNHAIDGGDAEAWADTFVDDGEFHGIVGEFVGRGQLVDFVRRLSAGEWQQSMDTRGTQHWVTNMIIEGDGNAARMRSHHILFRATRQGGEVAHMAAYDDHLVRTTGGWRFRTRRVSNWPPEAPLPGQISGHS